MIYPIKVWEQSTGKHQPVGSMVCELDESGRMRSAFRYELDCLDRGDAFAMDPASLPLRAGSFSTEYPGLFGVFEDSLPDDWGRTLLVRKHHIPRVGQNLPTLLLALGHSGLGALSFTEQATSNPPSPETSILHLATLVDAAEKFERGEREDNGLALLMNAGSSPGGARPKVVVLDGETGTHYLAKFPSVRDQVDVVRIEAATMTLAKKAGLSVPATRLVDCSGKSVLLIQRFDILPAGRRHMISFQTLLKAHGYYQSRYHELLAIVRKYSHDPQGDSDRLYRQMVFNAVVGNTDDHLKNFWMIHDHVQGWRLSPAFDLVPDIGRREEHVLFFDGGTTYPGRKTLLQLGRDWAIRHAEGIVAEVFDAATGWKEEFTNSGVPEKDIIRFKEIDSHLQE